MLDFVDVVARASCCFEFMLTYLGCWALEACSQRPVFEHTRNPICEMEKMSKTRFCIASALQGRRNSSNYIRGL